MNKKLISGLIVAAIVIILTVTLYFFTTRKPPQPVPSPAPGPAATDAPAVTPPPAPTTQELPVPQPSGEPESPKGITPLQEATPSGPEISIPPSSEPQEHSGILVGRYRKYQDAAKMLARLKKEGYPAFIQRAPGNSGQHEVWVGPFTSRREAEAAEKSLRALLKKPLKIESIENPVPK